MGRDICSVYDKSPTRFIVKVCNPIENWVNERLVVHRKGMISQHRKRCSDILIREIPIKVINKHQNGLFIINNRNILILVGSIH